MSALPELTHALEICTHAVAQERVELRTLEAQNLEFESTPGYLEYTARKLRIAAQQRALGSRKKQLALIHTQIADAHADLACRARTEACLRACKLWDQCPDSTQQWLLQELQICNEQTFDDYYNLLHCTVLSLHMNIRYNLEERTERSELNVITDNICKNFSDICTHIKYSSMMITCRDICVQPCDTPAGTHLGVLYPHMYAEYSRRMDILLQMLQCVGIDFSKYIQCLKNTAPSLKHMTTAVDMLLRIFLHKRDTVCNLIGDNLWYEHTDNATRINIALTNASATYQQLHTRYCTLDVTYWGVAIAGHFEHKMRWLNDAQYLNAVFTDPSMQQVWTDASAYCKAAHTNNEILWLMRSTYVGIMSEITAELKQIQHCDSSHIELPVLRKYQYILQSYNTLQLTEVLIKCDDVYKHHGKKFEDIYQLLSGLINSGFKWICTTPTQFKRVLTIIYDYMGIHRGNETAIDVRHNNYQYPYHMNDRSDIDIVYKCTDIHINFRRRYFADLLKYHRNCVAQHNVYILQYARLCEYVASQTAIELPRDILQFTAREYCGSVRPAALVYNRAHTRITDYLAGTISVELLLA